jgi:hypothetical protein
VDDPFVFRAFVVDEGVARSEMALRESFLANGQTAFDDHGELTEMRSTHRARVTALNADYLTRIFRSP